MLYKLHKLLKNKYSFNKFDDYYRIYVQMVSLVYFNFTISEDSDSEWKQKFHWVFICKTESTLVCFVQK